MAMTFRWITPAVLVLLAGGTTQALTLAEKCAAAKAKAAGAKVYAKAKCYQKALRTGAMVDTACLVKAEQKFVAAFGKAEAKGGCAVNGDAAAVEALVDACLASFTAAIAGDAKCAAAKVKAVGKKAADKTKCHQKALLKGTAVDPACLTKAATKFTAAIAKADGQGTCSDTASVLEALVDVCVGSLVVAPPTTSTTTTTSSTTTAPVCGNAIVEQGEECDGGAPRTEIDMLYLCADCAVALCCCPAVGPCVPSTGQHCPVGDIPYASYCCVSTVCFN